MLQNTSTHSCTEGFTRLGRPNSAGSIHMCVAEHRRSRLQPRLKGNCYCYCEHTHLCCRKGQLRVVPKDQGLRTFGRSSSAASIHTCIAVAPRGRNFTRASPTNCCCEHTHVCCRVGHLKVAPKDQVRPTKCCCEHTHVRYKINRIRAGRHVIRLRKTRCCCNHTHVCCGQGFDRPNAAVSTHTHM